MFNLSEFLKADYLLALLTSLFIFSITLYLTIKRWIGFSLSLFMLLLALGVGVGIRNYHIIETYLIAYQEEHHSEYENVNKGFKSQIAQAVADITVELKAEKENITVLVNQVEEMLDEVDKQKQKLESFIEETKERFKGEEEKLEENIINEINY